MFRDANVMVHFLVRFVSNCTDYFLKRCMDGLITEV